MKENHKYYDKIVYLIIAFSIIFVITFQLIKREFKNHQKKELTKIAKDINSLVIKRYQEEKARNEDTLRLYYKYTTKTEVMTGNEKINYEGKQPNGGVIIINDNEEVAMAIYNDFYCAKKDYGDKEIEVVRSSGYSCKIEEVEYQDNSGAIRPNVSNNIIAVIYKNNKWIKADLYNKWYDYDNKEWANAVLVKSETRSHYLYSSVGTEIKEEDVIAHLVWIPRYKYRIFNTNSNLIKKQLIEIEFESRNEVEDNSNADGEWMTHPAFNFNDEEIKGLWVGKFEATGTKEEPTVKPNEKALTNLNLKEQFESSNVFNDSDFYGITKINNAHTIKNTEWGAVVYLTQSKYGNNTGVWKNNSSLKITGCVGTSGVYDGCENDYRTEIGVKGSTTGNVTGIYDMNGGVREAVMAYTPSLKEFDRSGFKKQIAVRYYNLYQEGKTFNDSDAYKRRILGDATGETRNWDNGKALMLYDEFPWLVRGGDYQDSNTGIFSFQYDNGEDNDNIGFRIVIS